MVTRPRGETTRIGRKQPMRREAERRACARALARFSIRPPDGQVMSGTLSGGNQQKVVLARWLEAPLKVLILKEPTIAVDVGTKADIYQGLQEALAGGLSVLLISSDFEEVELLDRRALVFSRGRVVEEVRRDEASIARLTALAAGAAEHAHA